MTKELVLPIKDDNILKQVEDALLHDFRAGRRNYTIFQVGKATLLKVSAVLNLKISDVYDDNGNINFGKLYLQPVEDDLKKYYQWLANKKLLAGQWLFPSMTNITLPLTEKQYYKIMSQVGKKLNIDYLGTHTMRKTGAYRIYEQTNHDLALVTKLLNNSNDAVTLRYLHLQHESLTTRLNRIDFG